MFNEPIISDQLIHTGLSDKLVGNELNVLIHVVGYIFGLACLAYALAAPLITCLSNHFNKETLSLLSFLLSGIQLFVQGPSKLFGFKE